MKNEISQVKKRARSSCPREQPRESDGSLREAWAKAGRLCCSGTGHDGNGDR